LFALEFNTITDMPQINVKKAVHNSDSALHAASRASPMMNVHKKLSRVGREALMSQMNPPAIPVDSTSLRHREENGSGI
jgi:hypothetical protein